MEDILKEWEYMPSLEVCESVLYCVSLVLDVSGMQELKDCGLVFILFLFCSSDFSIMNMIMFVIWFGGSIYQKK